MQVVVLEIQLQPSGNVCIVGSYGDLHQPAWAPRSGNGTHRIASHQYQSGRRALSIACRCSVVRVPQLTSCLQPSRGSEHEAHFDLSEALDSQSELLQARTMVQVMENGYATTDQQTMPAPGAIVPVGPVKSVLPSPNLAAVKVDTQTRAIGLIQPPPDIRAIVDKTAQFVAKNGMQALVWTTLNGRCQLFNNILCYVGTQFEGRILANEKDNPKFNFLRTADPYHAYYRHMVRDNSSCLSLVGKNSCKACSRCSHAVSAVLRLTACSCRSQSTRKEQTVPNQQKQHQKTSRQQSSKSLQQVQLLEQRQWNLLKRRSTLYMCQKGSHTLIWISSRSQHSLLPEMAKAF